MTINRASHGLTSSMTWPDTSGQDQPPRDHLYASATWLLGRHPMLARLVQRVPGAVVTDEDALSLDLELLAEAFIGLADYHHAWQVYEKTQPAPDSDQQYDDWCEAGPAHSRATGALLPMSRGEITMLRMLATFAATRLPFSINDLWGFDGAYLRDWCRAVYFA